MSSQTDILYKETERLKIHMGIAGVAFFVALCQIFFWTGETSAADGPLSLIIWKAREFIALVSGGWGLVAWFNFRTKNKEYTEHVRRDCDDR